MQTGRGLVENEQLAMLEGFVSLALKALRIQVPVKEVPPLQLRVSHISQLQQGGGACLSKNGDADSNLSVVGGVRLL
jgi:hypothetical protein